VRVRHSDRAGLAFMFWGFRFDSRQWTPAIINKFLRSFPQSLRINAQIVS
jgi:hypothetical protein